MILAVHTVQNVRVPHHELKEKGSQRSDHHILACMYAKITSLGKMLAGPGDYKHRNGTSGRVVFVHESWIDDLSMG
jgi:hypothetical protein